MERGQSFDGWIALVAIDPCEASGDARCTNLVTDGRISHEFRLAQLNNCGKGAISVATYSMHRRVHPPLILALGNSSCSKQLPVKSTRLPVSASPRKVVPVPSSTCTLSQRLPWKGQVVPPAVREPGVDETALIESAGAELAIGEGASHEGATGPSGLLEGGVREARAGKTAARGLGQVQVQARTGRAVGWADQPGSGAAGTLAPEVVVGDDLL